MLLHVGRSAFREIQTQYHLRPGRIDRSLDERRCLSTHSEQTLWDWLEVPCFTQVGGATRSDSSFTLAIWVGTRWRESRMAGHTSSWETRILAMLDAMSGRIHC
jgi:hypothetical protein